jgi:hypothetical protein
MPDATRGHSQTRRRCASYFTPRGPQFIKKHHAIFVNVQAFIIDTSVEFFDVFENDGASILGDS